MVLVTNVKVLSSIIKFPKLDEEFIYPFLRGYFDGDGCVRLRGNGIQVMASITSNSKEMLASIKSVAELPCTLMEVAIEWNADNALIFLHLLYGDANYFLQRKYDKYLLAIDRRSKK
ncbi:MAG: LAGLIDADG family homing endonuclease [Candidatus Roizmanbacteria bacterium]